LIELSGVDSPWLRETLFKEQLSKLRYHFLRRESDLNKQDHPEWLFKYIKDQIENVSIRLTEVDHHAFIACFLKSLEVIVRERYEADSDEGSDCLWFLENLFEFDITHKSQFFSGLLSGLRDPSIMLSTLSKEYERHFNQTLDANYASSLAEVLRPYSLSLKTLLEDFRLFIVERYSIYPKTVIVLEQVIKPAVLAMQKAIKTKINNYELQMLNLTSKS